MDKYINVNCKYCNKNIDINYARSLICSNCNEHIHVTCLKRQSTPGGLSGDVFFHFTCSECSETRTEIFIREKMTWFQVVTLTIYHLQHNNFGTANKGFFHWKIHVMTFIDKNWDLLFKKDFKRKKNWMGTISGTLSHFSPCFFTSGVTDLGSTGWWRLTFSKLSPSFLVLIYNEFIAGKQANVKVSDDFVFVKMLINKYIPDMVFNVEQIVKVEKEDRLLNNIEDYNTLDVDVTGDIIPDSQNIFLHNFNICQAFDENSADDSDASSQKECVSLFRKSSSDFYEFWKNIECKNERITNEIPLKQLRGVEENALYQYVAKNCNDRYTRALKRKLAVRLIKRKKRLPLFNVDEMMQSPMKKESNERNRFSHYSTANRNYRVENERILLMSGSTELSEYLLSPYTNRLLKPYIRRDICPSSLWFRLMSELDYKVNSSKSSYKPCEFTTVDYCYVRPCHVPVLNSLCEQYFWPGIDLAEALEYPEFSCVVSYKKLIIGFAFMVPDVKFNETYISFIFTRPEWRRSGIATFMIYHLIQTCMGKDVTLHVAVDNPAIFLYQKFGFKVEEVVFNFYDTYLRDDSRKSKHAFFLRLER